MYQLIAEHSDFLVVNKQPEISIHNESNNGLIEQLRKDFKNNNIVPVHRLDKVTSGILLCAKGSESCSELSQLFQSRQVEKYYLALSHNKPSKKQGLIVGDMLRARGGSRKLSKTQHNPAITQFFSYSLGGGKRLFVLKPYTGKTHQLRVALKSVSAPIMGDKRYGPSSDDYNRTYLHAYSLRFQYKKSDYIYTCLPVGGEFSDTINTYIEQNFREPWQLSWPVLPRKYLLNSNSV